MRKYIFIVLFLLPVASFSQVVKPDGIFTDVYLIGDKVVFLKEIGLKSNRVETNYTYLCDWIKSNYAGSPFVSSWDLNKKEYSAHAVSRVELLLPKDSKGLRAKMIMKYTLDAFVVKDEHICVLEISNITFLNNASKNDNTLSDKIKAEDMITDGSLQIGDGNEEIRLNTKKSALFFLNELSLDLEKAFVE